MRDGKNIYIEKVLNVGDVVWHCPSWGLFVKCKITEIDTEFRDKSPGSYLFYDIDEPTGHSLSEDELFTSLDAVVQDSLRNINDYLRECTRENISPSAPSTLQEWRQEAINFIRGTQGEYAVPEDEFKSWYQEKKHGEDWVTLWDLV